MANSSLSYALQPQGGQDLSHLPVATAASYPYRYSTQSQFVQQQSYPNTYQGLSRVTTQPHEYASVKLEDSYDAPLKFEEPTDDWQASQHQHLDPIHNYVSRFRASPAAACTDGWSVPGGSGERLFRAVHTALQIPVRIHHEPASNRLSVIIIAHFVRTYYRHIRTLMHTISAHVTVVAVPQIWLYRACLFSSSRRMIGVERRHHAWCTESISVRWQARTEAVDKPAIEARRGAILRPTETRTATELSLALFHRAR